MSRYCVTHILLHNTYDESLKLKIIVRLSLTLFTYIFICLDTDSLQVNV